MQVCEDTSKAPKLLKVDCQLKPIFNENFMKFSDKNSLSFTLFSQACFTIILTALFLRIFSMLLLLVFILDFLIHVKKIMKSNMADL